MLKAVAIAGPGNSITPALSTLSCHTEVRNRTPDSNIAPKPAKKSTDADTVGERWSLLIVRNIFLGLRRFEELQANLGIARNILQTRLRRLVQEGVLERRLYSERPPRHEYR